MVGGVRVGSKKGDKKGGAGPQGGTSICDSSARAEGDLTFNAAITDSHLGRFTNMGKGLEGNICANGSDPTFTRWIPLSFSPVVSSQIFRVKSGHAPAPWGN